ncbi:hypothetical protein BDZ94DRAFT_1245999 [Collybia nuda]|uniref:Uncharacterized protein n=1 Tax=Collybia nuda TaxID=64659 RepID=A0A9P6CJE0_9AGAR|nr:hypothetical protein BDZ94DRAFT_1245999 [Collybia nuda]
MGYMRTSNALKCSGEPLLLPEGADTTVLPITKDELVYCFTCEQCDAAMVSLGIPLPPPDVSLADRRRLVGSALGVIC